MKKIVGLLALSLVWITAIDARAAVVYDQPPSFPGPFSGWTSDVDQFGLGFRSYDNFSLSGPTAITSVDWQGFNWDFVNTGNNPVGQTTNSWNLTFFFDG